MATHPCPLVSTALHHPHRSVALCCHMLAQPPVEHPVCHSRSLNSVNPGWKNGKGSAVQRTALRLPLATTDARLRQLLLLACPVPQAIGSALVRKSGQTLMERGGLFNKIRRWARLTLRHKMISRNLALASRLSTDRERRTISVSGVVGQNKSGEGIAVVRTRSCNGTGSPTFFFFFSFITD